MTRYGTSWNKTPYIPGPLSPCSIYGHEFITLKTGDIVCRECGAVHRQHEWVDRAEGGPVQMFPTGPEDSIRENVVCIICGMNKADWDKNHTSTVLP